jgi:ER membrane protein complex subunit 2
VAKLNEYLKENPNDPEAWLELGDLYTERSQYLRALFCYEEVIMLTPENDYYFLRLAELYYTDGGKANLATAVKYFSYVVSRNPKNPRALWGLYRSLWAQKEQLDENDKELIEVTIF